MAIATCGLHTIHGAFKYGVEKSDWKLKKIKDDTFFFMIAQLNEMIISLSLALKNLYYSFTWHVNLRNYCFVYCECWSA